jgi:hypothetical protein
VGACSLNSLVGIGSIALLGQIVAQRRCRFLAQSLLRQGFSQRIEAGRIVLAQIHEYPVLLDSPIQISFGLECHAQIITGAGAFRLQAEQMTVHRDCPVVQYTKLGLEFMTTWANNLWWTTIEPDLYVDWKQQGKTAMNLEFEVGRRLGDHFRVWLRPAVGLWGTGVPGAYDWFTQFGIRYMF